MPRQPVSGFNREDPSKDDLITGVIRKVMIGMMQAFTDAMPGMGIAIFVFDPAGTRANYMSNTDRPQTVEKIGEWVNRAKREMQQ